MFDFAWSELALIGVVALLAIGPKDMPQAARAAARAVRKLRAMAGEFQTHVEDMVREADLGDVRDQISALRGLNLRSQVERALDPFAAPGRSPAEAAPIDVAAHPPTSMADPDWRVPPPDHLRPGIDAAPACIPPPRVAAERRIQAAPAAIPPGIAAKG